MRKTIVVIGIALWMCFSMVLAVYGAECQKVIVTGNAEYPPLTWQDKTNPDKLIGFAIELLELAFAELDVTVEGRFVGRWARAQKEIEWGNVDMLGGAYITEERKTYMDFVTPPFVMDPTVIFVPKGKSFPFEKWEDLIGLTGGAPLGNSFGEEFDTFAEEHLTIERVPRLAQAFQKLEKGRNDYVVYGLYPGLAELEVIGVSDEIEYLPNSVIEEGLYFTFSKQSACNTPEVHAHLRQKIQEFTEQGVVQELLEKYLKIWKEQASE